MQLRTTVVTVYISKVPSERHLGWHPWDDIPETSGVTPLGDTPETGGDTLGMTPLALGVASLGWHP